MAEDFEDVSNFMLSAEREKVLYDKQTECTFMWTNRAGEPIGVIMNYVVRDGSFWLPRRVVGLGSRLSSAIPGWRSPSPAGGPTSASVRV